jgi:hypothetical protein
MTPILIFSQTQVHPPPPQKNMKMTVKLVCVVTTKVHQIQHGKYVTCSINIIWVSIDGDSVS